MLCLGVFGLLWTIARACLQSVVIDEADSYVFFAHPALSEHALLFPASGNHVLYTILSHFSTQLLGINELSLRTPALLGAAIYISAAYCLCVLVTIRATLQAILFIALVFNPFVLDYLVAARGYSLGIALMMAALATIGWILQRAAPALSWKACAMASACAGLSFCSAFPFAFADAAILVVLWLWGIGTYRTAGEKFRFSAAVFVPAVVVTGAICGRTLWHWPKGQLYWGSTSIGQFWDGLRESCFDRMNPALAGPWLERALSWVPGVAPWAGIAVLAIAAGLLPRQRNSGASVRMFFFFLTTLSLALAAHLFAFQAFGLLLPLDRTGLFIAPLSVLALGAAMGVPLETTAFRVVRWIGTGVLAISAFYFLGCLRLDHFREWIWNADAKHVYWVLTDLRRRCGVPDSSVEWRYTGALNFYRLYFNDKDLKEFVRGDPFQPGKPVYVTYYPSAKPFIDGQHLRVIYHNDLTETAVAVQDPVCVAP